MYMRCGIFLLCLMCYCIPVLEAQDQNLTPAMIGNIVEDFLETTEGENFDYNTVFENLHYYVEHPININKANANELRELILLNEIQISDFMQHKDKFGHFLSVYELQTIPSWDQNTLKNVAPFLSCEIAPADFNLNFKDALKKGTSTIYIKSKRVLEKRAGFLKDDAGNVPFLGDPLHAYIRYRYEYGQSFKIGCTMEKDAGEPFFQKQNKYGFDFYSFFVFARDINKTIKTALIGDYAVSLGQGLILHNNFGAGKSALVMNVKKAGQTIRPYSSVNEVNFFRGVALEAKLTSNTSMACFASYKPLDATVNDDSSNVSDFDSFGAIRMDGLHRTNAEFRNKNAIYQSNVGIKWTINYKKINISANGLYTHFDKAFARREPLFQKFQFTGTTLMNGSVDYTWRKRNLTFFGEFAWSGNGGQAQIHGLLMGLDKKMDVSVVYRNYDTEYQVLNANAFGESTQPINEKGIYVSTEIRPLKNITMSAYIDLWSHPWLGYRRDAPSQGKELLLRLNYVLKRKLDFSILYRIEQKQINSNGLNKIDFPENQQLKRLRIHLSYKLDKSWELRNRIEWSFFDKFATSQGILMYQDVLFKPITKDFSFNMRYVIFDVNGFDARIYAYENDLLYEFYIPFFQNRGTRFYFNTRFLFLKNYTFELRYGRTYFDDVEGISSGNNYIAGNTMSEIKAQLRIKF